MSGRLPNPLDNFATYSTHFIMLACRSTTRAREFADAAAATTLQAVNDTEYLGDAVKWQGSTSDVYLVMDTRRFSQFTVEKFHSEVKINGNQDSGAGHGNFFSAIKMTIIDSVGISFMNYLQWLLDSKMQCGFDGMIFMLRVIFVGHNVDGTTETVQTVTIPMWMKSMSVNLDYAKGTYECEFMPNFNFGVKEGHRWLQIGTATNFKNTTGNTLGQMVQSFEDTLNTLSATIYAAGGGRGRKVQYMITLPTKGWAEMAWNGGSVENALERDFKKKQEEAKKQEQKEAAKPGTTAENAALASFASADPGATITQVLDLMFKQVNEVRAKGAQATSDPTEPIVFYKYLVSITSDDAGFTVHVDVIEFSVPNVKPQKPNQQTFDEATKKFYVQTTQNGITNWIPKSYCEFDYIFTGKNIDILHFDMKIENLLLLLNSSVRVSEGQLFGDSLSDGQKPTIKDNPSSTGNDGKHASQASADMRPVRPYDPVLIPLVSREEKTNFSQYAPSRTDKTNKLLVDTSLAYAQNLSAFYARSPIHIDIEIKGNPDIFEKFNINKPAVHASPVTDTASSVSAANLTVKSDYRKDLEQKILKTQGATEGTRPGTFAVSNSLGNESFAVAPVFVKVNIKGPNVDPRSAVPESELVNGADFAKEVLYENFYRVMQVTNTIERGVFKQSLQLFSHNSYDGLVQSKGQTK